MTVGGIGIGLLILEGGAAPAALLVNVASVSANAETQFLRRLNNRPHSSACSLPELCSTATASRPNPFLTAVAGINKV
jgi:hypothetical protein